MPITRGNERDNTSVRILTSGIIKLEKLQEARMQAMKTIGIS